MNLKTLLNKLNPETAIVFSLFIVYFVFGSLKLLGVSPVEKIVDEVVRWVGQDKFFVLGIVEVVLGIGIVILKTRVIFSVLIIFHLIGVSLLSFLFPGFIFSHGTVLTIEGQFVVKNLVLIAAAYYLVWKNLSNKLQTEKL